MTIHTFPVATRTCIWEKEGKQIYFPEIIKYKDKGIMEKVNTKIKEAVRNLIRLQHKRQGFEYFDEMIGLYEIKTNERNILSLSLSNYAIHYQAAHGLTFIHSLTFDMKTGEVQPLSALFRPESHYITKISHIIQEQINKREIPILGTFTSISKEQDFYIADKSIVIYFQEYEISPYYVGLPMFPISIYDVEEIINQNGILERLLT